MQHLTFTRREPAQAFEVTFQDLCLGTSFRDQRNSRDDYVEQGLVAHRLSQKVHRPSLHSLNPQGGQPRDEGLR